MADRNLCRRSSGFFLGASLVVGDLDSVPSVVFGLIQRVVGKFDDLKDFVAFGIRSRHSDADRYRKLGVALSFRGVSSGSCFFLLAHGFSALDSTRECSGIFSPQLECCPLNGGAQQFEMLECVRSGLAAKEDGELLSAKTERFAATGDVGQSARYEAEHVITDIMSVGIVELLEVID